MLKGFDDKKFQELFDGKVTFEIFFKRANLNSKAQLITVVICSYSIEEIENPLTGQAGYSDKPADEPAKGKRRKRS